MVDLELKVDLPADPARVLCVDDEPNILSSLRRLLRSEGYKVLTANGGTEGLALMETSPVDLVISDMRMPEMDGARFLELVRGKWPDTMRILLTGYADVQSVLQAINRGEIYRYITKPWDDADLLLVVRLALERKALEYEKRRLEALTRQKNEELCELNATLEQRVEERTRDLRRAHQELVVANEKLRASYLTSIKVFANVIEMRGEKLAGHSRRVADLGRSIAAKMELDARDIQDIFIAGLLHNIGKVGFNDELLDMPVSLMKGDHLGQYRKYPMRGEQLLMPLDDLRTAAGLIRSHQERFDGAGFPDGLSGFDIPLGARILAVASDYDNLQIGALAQRRLRPDEARALIAREKGRRYDPAVVGAFIGVSDGSSIEALPGEVMSASELKPGMVVARDLVTRDGFLLLSADHVLTERLIQQIVEFEQSAGVPLIIYIQPIRKQS